MIRTAKASTLTALTMTMSKARRLGGPEAAALRSAAAVRLQDRFRQAHPDPVAGACHGTIALMDHCRYEQTGTRRKSNRSRQAIKNHGEIGFMTLVALCKSERSGFTLLVTGGLGVCTIESLVLAHFERFPTKAVAAAKAYLLAHGIPLPH
ncbi:hypothetical protein [Methylobacterium sp. Leaf466]|uniref:hypothetical protein n=1 Tax=Methylobacterium sp. Leaf466 TaxID=1736386 RepID=UPI0006F77B90|nr:hypothetical protein [Methylobacterium sp. Leaf466]KQT90360.1 hypothetical protein ASG59_00720 [Methylobacterium sp. Leaf466]